MNIDVFNSRKRFSKNKSKRRNHNRNLIYQKDKQNQKIYDKVGKNICMMKEN